MGAIAHTGWLYAVLRHLPASWLTTLDAWSHGIALKQRERRRLSALVPRPAEPTAYKLKHWRD